MNVEAVILSLLVMSKLLFNIEIGVIDIDVPLPVSRGCCSVLVEKFHFFKIRMFVVLMVYPL